LGIASILVGLLAGLLSGFAGIGGGIVIVPALVTFFHLTQHQAQGTSLAVLIPPVGILAAWKYWQSNNIRIDFAIWIVIGFFIGGLAGASIAQILPDAILKRAFGVLLLIMGAKFALGK
jgi:uncharacterized membrane protein YfcA